MGFDFRKGLLFLTLCLVSQGVIITRKDAVDDLKEVQLNVIQAKEHFRNVGLDEHYKTRLDFLDQQIVTLRNLLDERYTSKSMIGNGAEISDQEHNLDARKLVRLGASLKETKEGDQLLSNLAILLTVLVFSELLVYSRDRELHPFRKSIFMAIRLMLKHDLAKLTTIQNTLRDRMITGYLLRCALIEDEIKSLPNRFILTNHGDYASRPKHMLPTLFEDDFWYQMVESIEKTKLEEVQKIEVPRALERIREQQHLGPPDSKRRLQQKINNQRANPKYPDVFNNIIHAQRYPEVNDPDNLYNWAAGVLGFQLRVT